MRNKRFREDKYLLELCGIAAFIEKKRSTFPRSQLGIDRAGIHI